MLLRFAALIALIFLSACGFTGGPVPAASEDVARLEANIRGLGGEVDPEEAARAARIAYSYTYELAQRYRITDPPLIHNTKVNFGLKPRGLCWHWAEDMERRLEAENFQTLDLHRAIANADNAFRIDHSTVIIGASGDAWDEGIVLDPWRRGGRLFWEAVATDDAYNWVERREVFARRRAERLAAAAY